MKQDKQCTCNVTIRRFLVTIVAMEKQNYYIFFCVCGACVRVALLIQHATHVRHIVTSFVASLAPAHFSSLSSKRHDFQKNYWK